jgi:hypothetical protein
VDLACVHNIPAHVYLTRTFKRGSTTLLAAKAAAAAAAAAKAAAKAAACRAGL